MHALRGIIRYAAVDWSVRGEAMNCLRTIDAPDDIIEQAIAAAQADTGEHAGCRAAKNDETGKSMFINEFQLP